MNSLDVSPDLAQEIISKTSKPTENDSNSKQLGEKLRTEL
jgi:hypothetical protein